MSPTPAVPPAGSSIPSLRVLALFLALAVGSRAPAGPNELGHPIVRDFPPGRSNINHLCQAITQDDAGFIYLANALTLRFYDGDTWPLITLPTECAGIRKFARTADGTIFAGGAGVIGYLRGSGEAGVFVSLADRLPPTASGCDNLFDMLALGSTVYFADEEKILIWRDQRFTVIPCATPPHSRGARLHRVGGTVYVTALGHPLYRIEHDKLIFVADAAVLRENQIISIAAGPGGALSLLTAEQGFFLLAAGRVTPRTLETNRWLAGRTILRAHYLADHSLVVAFTSVSGDGGMRFDAAGRYVGPIDNSIGLYVKTLRDFFCDREGGLWLGTETGLFRLEWPSAATVFDAFNGLGAGAVADVTRHDGVLYAATTEGVYQLMPSDAAGRGAHFERVFDRPTYSLLSLPAGLVVLGYSEVFIYSAPGFTRVAAVPAGGGSLLRSKRDPHRVWIITTSGLHSILHSAGSWRDEGIAGSERSSDEVTADLSHPGESDSLWHADATGIFLASARGDPPRALPQLVRETTGPIAHLREEPGPDGAVLWVCGAKGLVRVEVARAFTASVPFATMLTTPDLRAGDRLKPVHPVIHFNFVAPRHQIAHGVTYQTRLVGDDSAWSPWGPGRERTFDHLSAGDYRFEVRARDADGQLSAPAALAFIVLPPWWGTGWALVGYVLVGIGLFAGGVRLRTRSLHRRADHLERIVTERTHELARKNLELIRLHQLELDEKITARLAEEKARLEVLRYQLNPHFLFNTLASISAALPAGLGPARAMVERLAAFCRLTLHRPDDRDWTTLGEEVHLLRAYLAIEQSRWGDLLDVTLDVDSALAEVQLPHFLLLPLVENALKYGRATSTDRVGLRLSARRAEAGALVLAVANTGRWVEPAATKTVSSLGIGLENLRERLRRHYPRAHQLDITTADGWVTVTLRILRTPAG